MQTIRARNVNDALAKGINYLLKEGVKENSRNGKVLVAPGPVVTIYEKPCERVLFSGWRDANPFFHLMESLWMIAGNNDLKFPMFFNKNFAEYSDDGLTLHGAYGHRWREHFGYDQISIIIDELKKNNTSRRCVLTMWDASLDDPMMQPPGADDLHRAVGNGKDVPCNTHAYFDLRGGRLNMTVCCRSNDIIWGAYGANAVHFSILQEYIAAALGLSVGLYRQFSNNFHVYTEVHGLFKLCNMANESIRTNYYDEYSPYPLLMDSEQLDTWNTDLSTFMTEPHAECKYNTEFFKGVVAPMYKAWFERKNKISDGRKQVGNIIAQEWRIACNDWINRREAA